MADSAFHGHPLALCRPRHREPTSSLISPLNGPIFSVRSSAAPREPPKSGGVRALVKWPHLALCLARFLAPISRGNSVRSVLWTSNG